MPPPPLSPPMSSIPSGVSTRASTTTSTGSTSASSRRSRSERSSGPANEVMDEALRWLGKTRVRSFSPGSTSTIRIRPMSRLRPSTKTVCQDHPYLGRSLSPILSSARLWQLLEQNGLARKLLPGLRRATTAKAWASTGSHPRLLRLPGSHPRSADFRHSFLEAPGALRGLQVVSLADVMPTVLEMAGLPIPAQVQGTSLLSGFFKP